MTTGRPTQADAAKLAGVSQAAVSIELTGNDYSIPEHTRQPILGSMDQLGYVPNRTAHSCALRKRSPVAAIIADITPPLFMRPFSVGSNRWPINKIAI